MILTHLANPRICQIGTHRRKTNFCEEIFNFIKICISQAFVKIPSFYILPITDFFDFFCTCTINFDLYYHIVVKKYQDQNLISIVFLLLRSILNE